MNTRDPLPTIPAQEYPERWASVQRMMEQHGLELVLAYADDRATFGPAHARWLADFPVHFEPVCILISRRGDPVMLCGPESDQYALLAGQIPDVRVLQAFTHPDEDYPYSNIQSLSEILPDVVHDLRLVRKVGIAGQGLMGSDILSAFRETLDVQWVDIENAMCDLRAVKSPSEIDVIRYAYKIAESGLVAGVNAIQVGVTEREVAAEAEAAMRRAGAEGTGIDTIVASGPNSRPILARSTFRRVRAERYCQMLWIGTPSVASISGMSMNNSSDSRSHCSISASPSGNSTPALTRATRCGALTRRQRR